MAKAQIGDRHGEQAENKDQRAIGERQILGKELSAGAGQATAVTGQAMKISAASRKLPAPPKVCCT